MIEDEMKAIRKVTAALEGLPQRARSRVMRYVFDSEADREPAPFGTAVVSTWSSVGGTRLKTTAPEASLGEVPPPQCREPDLDAD